MPTNEHKTCPKCGNTFLCKPHDITACQCYGFVFTESQRQQMRNTFSDCLCSNCLAQIQQGIEVVQKP